MRIRNSIAKFLAVFLLVIFSQKIGIGIYLHNWLHLQECNKQELSLGDRNIHKVCHCIDDFSLPFTKPVETVVITPSFALPQQVGLYTQFNPAVFARFTPLRGPPALMA